MNKILPFLHNLYALQDKSSLVQRIIDGLPDLISGDNFMVGQHDSHSRTPLNLSLKHPASRSDILSVVCETGAMKDHPIWSPNPDPTNPTKVLSDMMTRAEWESHPMYCEILVEDGVMDHLTIEFGRDRRVNYMIGVTRSRRGFSSRDRKTLAMLIPHFKQAFSNARLFQTCHIPNGTHALAPGSTYLIDRQGKLLDSGRDAQARWVRLFEGNASQVVENLNAWIRLHVDLLNRGVIDSAIAPFRVRACMRMVEFRLHRQWGGEGYILSQQVLANSTPRSDTLSPREQDVLRWVREGKTNGEIAMILRMSRYTVKDHLKHIFTKLGVDNRTAAARLVPPES